MILTINGPHYVTADCSGIQARYKTKQGGCYLLRGRSWGIALRELREIRREILKREREEIVGMDAMGAKLSARNALNEVRPAMIIDKQ